MTAQIIFLVLMGISLLIAANQHGKPKQGNFNFWTTFFAVLIELGILYWGGFFNVFFP